jgi:hypothetical protein
MFNKKTGLVIALVSLSVGDLFAGTLTSYSVGDVLLCFRKSGGVNDLVVDIGPVATYTNAAANQRITITQYTGTQLATVGTNAAIWSAFTYFDGTVTPSSSQYTLFATSPRSSLNTQTTPVVGARKGSQELTTLTMENVPAGADFYATYTNLNTSTAVVEPDSISGYVSGESYSYAILGQNGSDANFQENYQGFPEATTPGNFTTASTVQRADFYWVPPVNGQISTYLGYFELNTNGVMTYVAYPSAVPATPVIEKIGRTNNISYITFTTGSSGTYTLRGTNVLAGSGPVTNWPAITSVAGNNSINILQDSTTISNKFYVITAQ